MTKKVIVVIMLVFSLLLASCYPELSVQQYDKLKADLAALDTERQQLRERVTSLETALAAVEAEHTKSLAYIRFLEKLVSTQSSEKILSGQFDTASLINAREGLTALANQLEDNEIVYFLGLITPDNDGQTVAAYYKIIEYSLKKIKQNLE